MYSLLLYVHILSGVASIGPFLILFPLLPKMRRATQESLSHYVPMFKYAVRLCKHAGHVLVISGALLIWITHWTWLTSWVVMTLVVMFGSLFFIARAFSPALRKIMEPEADKEALTAKLRLNLILYLILMLLMMWFMVAKPELW
ncbi:hypothetical protein [Paenibacillus sp. SAFN-117]|uniref:hypothetical protein n=1 Tax=Paenibacillus sp. SAFN-117 TaxID=3436860 RepID=UPI003F7EC74E